MYSTTIVVVVDELAVAFLLLVIFMPVKFALAVVSAVDRLPLDAADEMSDVNELVRLAALPLYSVVSRRLVVVVRARNDSFEAHLERKMHIDLGNHPCSVGDVFAA